MFGKNKSLDRIAEALEDFVGIQKEALEKVRLLLPGAPTPAIPAPEAIRELPDGEREKAIDDVLDTLDDEIKNTGPKLLKAAIKEAMMDSKKSKEEIQEIAEKLKTAEGKRLKRKRGCLFIEIGDGIEQPIEEIHIRV